MTNQLNRTKNNHLSTTCLQRVGASAVPLLTAGLLVAGPLPAATAAPVPTEVSAAAAGDFAVEESSSAAEVKALQYLLNATGADLEVDGKFGPATTEAVETFQSDKGLEVDGIAGPKTMAALTKGEADGSADAETVKAAQVLLNAAVGGLDVDGKFGPATTEATEDFQSEAGLGVSGTVDADTWQALFTAEPAGGSGGLTDAERDEVIATASGELGTPEGPDADKYFYGDWGSLSGSEDEWCAGFVSWVTESQLGLQPHNSVRVEEYVDYAESGDGLVVTEDPQPGDLIAFDWDSDGSWNHIGIVEEAGADGSVSTIEGNTEGPRGSDEVAQKDRTENGSYDVIYLAIK